MIVSVDIAKYQMPVLLYRHQLSKELSLGITVAVETRATV